MLVDERSTRILLAAYDDPYTAMEISKLTGMQVALCCSRIRLLSERGLLMKIEPKEDINGLSKPMYRSMIYSPFIFTSNGKLKVRFSLVPCCNEDLSWMLL